MKKLIILVLVILLIIFSYPIAAFSLNDIVKSITGSVTKSKYATYEIKYKGGQDFSKAGGPSSAPAIYLYSSIAYGFTIITPTKDKNQKTSEIWLEKGGLPPNVIRIYYKNKEGKLVNIGNVGSTGSVLYIAKVSNEIKVGFLGQNITHPYGGGETLIITSPVDHLLISLKLKNYNDFAGFGTTADTAEACELIYNWECIGTKDEDYKTSYGIIIRDPKDAFSSDSGGIKLEIPLKYTKVTKSK